MEVSSKSKGRLSIRHLNETLFQGEGETRNFVMSHVWNTLLQGGKSTWKIGVFQCFKKCALHATKNAVKSFLSLKEIMEDYMSYVV